MKNALLYIRWSTKDQNQGDSLERQTRLGEAAARNRWIIRETLIEDGKSAFHARNRAEGGKLYEIEGRAARGELRGWVLIVEGLDRLSRQKPLESLVLLGNLINAGIEVHESSTGAHYDSDALESEWHKLSMALLRAGEAHTSSSIKSERITSSWRVKQATGQKKKGGADPRLAPSWMEVRKGEFVPIPERVDVVTQAFQLAIDGKGLKISCRLLNQNRKVIGWPSTPWNIRKLSVLLSDRRVIGEYQPMKRKAGGGREPAGPPVSFYEPVISLEMFHRARSARTARTGTGGAHRAKAKNLLSQLARCGATAEGENIHCGSRMVLRPQARGPNQLVCRSFATAGNCESNACYRYDDLVRGILDNVGDLLLVDQPQGDDAEALVAMRNELEARIARQAELADQMMEEDDDTLRAAYKRYKDKTEALEQSLQARERALEAEQRSG